MALIGTKKTLNLHKYSLKVTEILANWKIIVPVIFSLAGILTGCIRGKGESRAYLTVTEYFKSVILGNESATIGSEFILYLILPTIFIMIIFFLGLSVFGSLITYTVPMLYGYIIGCTSFFLYSEYILKGLAYCIIMIFPYGVLCLLSIVLCCRESINMSTYIINSISKTSKFLNYGFNVYYKSFLKNFVFIIIAAAIKTLIEYLFGGLFAF